MPPPTTTTRETRSKTVLTDDRGPTGARLTPVMETKALPTKTAASTSTRASISVDAEMKRMLQESLLTIDGLNKTVEGLQQEIASLRLHMREQYEQSRKDLMASREDAKQRELFFQQENKLLREELAKEKETMMAYLARTLGVDQQRPLPVVDLYDVHASDAGTSHDVTLHRKN
uniref:Uncharacterized protein n=1 Tax=Anopheles maculatus TaxID=74869 RepID=A0A182T4R4_9DIPT